MVELLMVLRADLKCFPEARKIRCGSFQLLAQAGSNEAMYRVNVQLADQAIKAYGENIALKPGLTLEADVLQESRKVWEWVLEPVLAARQQVRVLAKG